MLTSTALLLRQRLTPVNPSSVRRSTWTLLPQGCSTSSGMPSGANTTPSAPRRPTATGSGGIFCFMAKSTPHGSRADRTFPDPFGGYRQSGGFPQNQALWSFVIPTKHKLIEKINKKRRFGRIYISNCQYGEK